MICYSCKLDKPDSDFYMSNDMCKLCKKAYNKEYYLRTKERHNPSRRERTELMRNIARSFILEYLGSHPCVDCGEDDPIVLEFDHLEDKTHNISAMIGSGMTVASIIVEINKCQVVCSNCHKRRTAKTFGWYKLMPS